MFAQASRCVGKVVTAVVVVLFALLAAPLLVHGASITYDHDANGRLKKATYDNGTVVDYIYDSNGNRTDVIVTLPVDNTPPSAPANLTAAAVSHTQINLNWTAASDNVGVTGYRLERCAGAGCSNFSLIATPTGTAYSDAGRSPGTTYVYRVNARDASGNESGFSPNASATTPDTTSPSAPGTPTFNNITMTSATASWAAATDDVAVVGYEGRTNADSWQSLGNVLSTTLTGLSAVTSYTFQVRARDGANNVGLASSATFTTPDTAPPSAPTALSASAPNSSTVNLSWTASTDNVAVTGYRIFRNGGQIGTTSTTSYVDSTVSGTTTYSYTVIAHDAAGNNSASSNPAGVITPDTIAPSTPTDLSASAASSTQVNLSWNAASDTGGSGLAGYRIYRGGTQVATRAGTSYSDTTVAPNTPYSYTVVAYDNANNASNPSVAASTTTQPDAAAPSIPGAPTATVAGDTQVNLSWNGSSDSGGSGLAGYRIYRGGTHIGTSATTSFSDTSVSPFYNYSYTVAAYDNAGNTSAQSPAATAKTYYEITDGSGNVLSSAASLYTRTSGCQTNPVICHWVLRQAYGSQASVVVVTTGVGGTAPACNGGTTQQIAAGYQRFGCLVSAMPSKYGQ